MIRPAKLDRDALIKALSNHQDWALNADGTAIERSFKFKDFVKAWTFMCRIAAEAERTDHHPEWSNVYNRVSIRLTTHDAGGLTQLDFDLAQAIETYL